MGLLHKMMCHLVLETNSVHFLNIKKLMFGTKYSVSAARQKFVTII
jgi:hypothetical protein